MNEEQKNNENFIQKIIRLWNKVPEGIKPYIPPVGLLILKIVLSILIVLIILTLVMAPAGAVMEFLDGLGGIWNNVAGFFEKIGNLFSDGSFESNEKLAEKYEQEFYQEVDNRKVYYKENYKIEIDTVLIVSTLFYERTFGDIIEDIADDENFNPEDQSAKENKEFYKNALNRIDLLARWQIVNVISEAKCANVSTISVVTSPESDEEIAKTTNNEKRITMTKPYNNGLPRCDFDDISAELIERNETINNKLASLQSVINSTCSIITPGPGGVILTPQSTLSRKFELKQIENSLGLSQSCIDAINETRSLTTEKNSMAEFFNSEGEFVCSGDYKTGDNYNGCARQPYKSEYQMVDIKREGVYYYKLLNYEVVPGRTIIEGFYPDSFKNIEPENIQNKRIELVEGIYDLYESLREVVAGSGLEVGEFFMLRKKSVEGYETGDPSHAYYWTSFNGFYSAGIRGNYDPGQCTTYVYGRVREVEISTTSMCDGKPFDIGGHASQWFNYAKNAGRYNLSEDINTPRPGAVIVWGGGSEGYGHVAFVEKVYYGENGKILMDYSEGNAIGNKPYNIQGFRYNEGIEPSKIEKKGPLTFRGYIYAICIENLANLMGQNTEVNS